MLPNGVNDYVVNVGKQDIESKTSRRILVTSKITGSPLAIMELMVELSSINNSLTCVWVLEAELYELVEIAKGSMCDRNPILVCSHFI